MRYDILGPLQVHDGDRPVSVSQGKQRVLLAVLLLHANEAISSDRLIDWLWGEAPPATAARSLHNLVSNLRKSLGEGLLVTRGRGYLLHVGEGELDAERFEALADAGREAMAKGDPQRAATVLREALQLWRGPPLDDLAYEPALQAEAARLDERRLEAVEERIDADLALGRHAGLVAELDGLVAEHPLRERLRAQQMLALYRCGRQADALRVYGDARRRLVDELGIEPGPALRQLERAVLEQDPALGTPDRLPAPPERTPVPAVARARRHPVVLAAAGMLLLAAAIAAVVLVGGSGSGTKGLSSPAGNSLAAIDWATNRIVAEFPIGGTPTSVAVGAGAVWALNADDRTIARVDPDSEQVRTFAIGETPTDLVAGPGALWIASGPVGPGSSGAAATHLQRLDRDGAVVRGPIELPPASHQGSPGLPGQAAVARGAVWAINQGEDLVRIDARTARVTHKVRGAAARAVAAAGDSVWALEANETTVFRIDPQTARVRARLKIGAAQLDAIAAGAGAVWAVDAYEGTLWRIDPGPKTLTRTIPVGVGADGVAVGGGAVWVINSLRGTLVRVDPRRNRVSGTVAVGNTPRDIDVGAGRVWVTLAGGAEPVPAAAAASEAGPKVLPGPACGRVFSGAGGPPDRLIASDVPLQAGPKAGTRPLANAVAFVLRQHGFRAGRFRIGYQSCDDSTATSGQSDADKCEANAKAYAATSAVVGVVGPYNSDCAQVEIPILNRAPAGPLALISPSVSLVGLTHQDPLAPRGALARLYPTGVRNFARVYPAADAEAAADVLLALQLGVGRAYVLDDGTPVGRELALHFRRSAHAQGLRVAGSARWNQNGSGFPALGRRIERARADGVFVSGIVGSSGGQLVRALRTGLGERVALIAPNPFAPVDFLFDASGGAAKGMYLSNPGPPNEHLGASGRRFLRGFAATQPGVPVGNFAVYAAAATEALLDAIARSDGTRASVSGGLIATRLRDGIIGPLRFDRNGDLAQPAVTIMRVRRRDGVSAVKFYEGAEIDRVIVPPQSTIR